VRSIQTKNRQLGHRVTKRHNIVSNRRSREVSEGDCLRSAADSGGPPVFENFGLVFILNIDFSEVFHAYLPFRSLA
jgi:hypothetical protein